MALVYEDNKPVLKTTINGSEVIVRFTDTPQPNVKETIIEMLTSCYERRVQGAIKASMKRETK